MAVRGILLYAQDVAVLSKKSKPVGESAVVSSTWFSPKVIDADDEQRDFDGCLMRHPK